MTEDANARVRSYLLSQAERYDWTALWPRVMHARLDLIEALEGVSDEQATWRPVAEAWSIGDCALHLLTSSRNNRRLIEGLMRGEQRRDDPDAPLTADDAPVQEVRTALIEDGARFGALITAVPDDLDPDLRIEHRMFGPLNAREWFLFQRLHDTDHAAQIRAVREAEGYPAESGSGVMTTDRTTAIRERLLTAAERGFVDLWPRVIAQRAAFLEMLRGLNDEGARRRPEGDADGEAVWSAVEVAQHVLSYTRNVGAIIEATAQGRTETKLPPGHLVPDPDATLEDVRREVTSASAWLVDLARRLPETPELDTTVAHAAFGELNCKAWLAFIELHDGIHAAQVQALRDAPVPEAVPSEGVTRERLEGAATHDVIDLWPAVAARRAALLESLADLDERQARWRPGTGEGEEAWSAVEVAQHLAIWSRNVSDVVAALAQGQTETKLPPGYIEPDLEASLEWVRADLTAASSQFLSVIERLPREPDLEATVAHRAHGPLNSRMWFAMAHIHDLDHTRQIETLKQAAGFPR